MRKIAYVAVDDGPTATLRALAAVLPGSWLDTACARTMRVEQTGLLICGTSDSRLGRQVEAQACRAASSLRVPVVIVEDFPGNFAPMAEATPGLLCVESEFAAALARAKARDAALPVHVGPAIRYDGLRRRLTELRAYGESADAVLWIGQPETAESLEALTLVIPALRAHGVRFWLRAHPRDEGYVNGAYDRWCRNAASRVDDVTAWALEDCFRKRPRLVITQFSSAAVEAGFWGIPALNVLLPEGAAGRLVRTKGYAIPPWCGAGAAFLATGRSDIEVALRLALDDEARRKQAQERFDRYFMVEDEGVPALVNVLYNQRFLP